MLAPQISCSRHRKCGTHPLHIEELIGDFVCVSESSKLAARSDIWRGLRLDATIIPLWDFPLMMYSLWSIS